MNGDKITISMDEVNRAEPVPGATVPPNFTTGYAPHGSGSDVKSRRTALFVGIGIAVVALFCMVGIIGVAALVGDNGSYITKSEPELTVSDYRARFMREVGEELAKSSALRKRIEEAHVTVTVGSAEIVRCDVTTVDGSDKAGKDDANIDRVSTLIRFRWTGMIDAGYTDLRIVYDVRNKRLEKSEIEYTTALVNVEDPSFWYGVGSLIGSMFL